MIVTDTVCPDRSGPPTVMPAQAGIHDFTQHRAHGTEVVDARLRGHDGGGRR